LSSRKARALLIDYGGVLYVESEDFRESLRSSILKYLLRIGVSNASMESVGNAMDSWSLEGPVEQEIGYAAAHVLAKHGVTPKPSVVKGLEAVMKAQVILNTEPLPWAKKLLRIAADAGLRVALVSNHWCHECVLATMERDGLLKYFDAIVTSDLVGYCKPDRHIYEAALRLLNVNPSEAIFVDDNHANVEGALNAGLLDAHRFARESGVEALRGFEDFILKYACGHPRSLARG